ncbi:MAG: hypothetical protein ABIJ12_11405 [bacterium]
MKSWLLVLVIALQFIHVESKAITMDDSRKGFVIGVGGGLGLGSFSTSNTENFDDSKLGLGFDFLIGYGWNERNMIVFQRDMILKKVNDGYSIYNFAGIGYFHYLNSTGKSPYFNIGFSFIPFFDNDYDGLDFDRKLRLIVGGGYKFSKHYQFHTCIWYNGFHKYYHLITTVTWVAF